MKEILSNLDPAYVLEAAKVGLMFILAALSLYYRSNTRLQSLVNKYIATAEVLFTDNGDRFNWVVSEAYKIVPTALKPFITKALVEKIVQSMFEGAKAYARAQADKTVDILCGSEEASE